MSEATEAAQAQKLLESLGYTVFRGAQKPARLPRKELYDRPFVPAPTLVDHRRSAIVEQTARAGNAQHAKLTIISPLASA